MTLKTKIILTIIPTFLYLAVTKNYSSSINSEKEGTKLHYIIDSLNAENQRKNLERTIKLEEAKKEAEFDTTIYQPEYINKKILNSYIDTLYSRGIAPKEISKDLFKKIISIESSYNVNAFEKSTGARGLGQLLEPAWKEVNKTLSYRENVYNPEKNLETSLRYLKSLKIALKSINPEFEKLSKQEKLKHIITAYNWGIGKFQEANFNLNKVPAETKNFFKKLGLN